MKRTHFLSIMVFAVLAAILSSCSKSTPDYARLIPKEAEVVIRMDVKQIYEKAGDADSEKLSRQLKQALMNQGLSQQFTDKLKAIIDDPAEAGVDLRKPLLGFLVDDKEGFTGMVGKLHDSEKFGELIKAIATETQEEAPKDTNDVWVTKMEDIVVSYNDDWFMLSSIRGFPDEKIEAAVKRYAAKDEESVLDRDDVNEMCKSDGDIQVLITGEAVEDYYGESASAQLKGMLPEGVSFKDFVTLLDFNTEKGEVALKAKYIAKTDEAKKYVEQFTQSVSKVDGKFSKYISEDALFALSYSAKDGKLYDQIIELMQKSGDVNEQELTIIKEVLSSLDGEVTLAVNSLQMESGPAQIDAFLLADAKSSKGLNAIAQKLGEDVMKEISPSQYVADGNTYIGIVDDVFYVSMKEPFSEKKEADKALDLDDLEGSYGYAVFNVKALSKIPMLGYMMGFHGRQANYAEQAFQYFTQIDCKIEEPGEATLRVKLSDKEHNLWELLSNEVQKQMNS